MSEYSLLLGDAVQVMRGLPANSVQCVITSPPYFGLRDYQTATWDGGDAECDHRETDRRDSRPKGSFHGGNDESQTHPYRDICGKCGARRIDNQIGLEPTVDAYVAKLVEVFREVRRVLHPSGVVFLNLGDSYNGSGGAGGDYGEGGLKEGQPKYPGRRVNGLKPKDLCMIPARVAIALQDDGWWLRQEIVWHKRAPMPESCTDRCTRAHEMVYMLAKSPNYFYDHIAIAEPATTGTDLGILRTRQQNLDRNDYTRRQQAIEMGIDSRNGNPSGTRNKRSVWTLGPENSGIAGHFAVMPSKLAEICILAGSSQYGACSKCLAPWARVVVQDGYVKAGHGGGTNKLANHVDLSVTSSLRAEGMKRNMIAVGWQPTCTCNADVVPCTVLDPFNGSGTTGAVALKYHRRYIGIDLNADYLELAHRRIQQSQPLLFALEVQP